MDVHFPYDPPPPFRTLYSEKKGITPLQVNGPPKERIPQEIIDYSMDLYDAQINYWDDSFRQLIAALKEKGWLDNTVVIVVSDHGDEFNEHGGFGHGYTLYTEMIHVPMYFISEEGIPQGIVRDDVVGLIDVAPTICGLAGIETEGYDFQGRDLFGEDASSTSSIGAIYAETFKGKKPRAVRTADYQLIYNSGPQSWELYNVRLDNEMKDAIPRDEVGQSDRLAMMLTEFMQGRDIGISQEEVELDEETIEELRSLGYLD
jgi:arylsulfatase A-like enzyme